MKYQLFDIAVVTVSIAWLYSLELSVYIINYVNVFRVPYATQSTPSFVYDSFSLYTFFW